VQKKHPLSCVGPG